MLISKRDARPPAGFEQIVPIVLSVNDNYVPYLGVTIEYIPQNAGEYNFYRKVIYLDCDLVLSPDIADMIPDNTGNHLVAGVRNHALQNTADRLLRDFSLDADKYLNVGVLVISVA